MARYEKKQRTRRKERKPTQENDGKKRKGRAEIWLGEIKYIYSDLSDFGSGSGTSIPLLVVAVVVMVAGAVAVAVAVLLASSGAVVDRRHGMGKTP